MNTVERRQCRLSGAFIVKWEYVSQFVLIATLNRQKFAGFILKIQKHF